MEEVDPSALPEFAAALSVPPLIVVVPENVFAPVSVSVPAPVLSRLTSPCDPPFVPAITPLNVVETPVLGFTVNVLVVLVTLFLTIPLLSPVSEATASL